MAFKPQEPPLKPTQSSPRAPEHQKAPPDTRGCAGTGMNPLQGFGIRSFSTSAGDVTEELHSPAAGAPRQTHTSHGQEALPGSGMSSWDHSGRAEGSKPRRARGAPCRALTGDFLNPTPGNAVKPHPTKALES